MVTIGGNFQNSLETTSLLKELGAKTVVSRAERDVQKKFLLRNGADEVVYPDIQLTDCFGNPVFWNFHFKNCMCLIHQNIIAYVIGSIPEKIRNQYCCHPGRQQN